MDTCELTREQVAALAAGRTVRTEYSSPGEYGFMASLEIEIVPPPAEGANSSDGARRRTDDNLRDAFRGEKPC